MNTVNFICAANRCVKEQSFTSAIYFLCRLGR